MASSFGEKLHITIYGESHGPSIGTLIEGFPAGEKIDLDALQAFLARRAPGRTQYSTARRESDIPQIQSGIRDGVTTGSPINILFQNNDVRSRDYAALKDVPRPGHADYTARIRYGGSADMRGGGHFSGRLTAPLCAAGGLALQFLAGRGIRIGAHILQIANICDVPFDPVRVCGEDFERILTAPFPVLDETAGSAMQEVILETKEKGDSVGGRIECAITGVPAGLGDPMFDGIENRISRVVFGIPAVKAVGFGAGEQYASMNGSAANDPFAVENGHVVTATNHCGGILGGISDGMPIIFCATFKPTPSIAQAQQSVDLSTMQPVTLEIKGRHDPCIVPRAVPCIEAAAACSIMDLLLTQNERKD